jgi:hypothetical protein
LSRQFEKSYRNTIDKNGLVIEAVIIGKKYSKGHYDVFKYSHKGKSYKNSEMNDRYYNWVSIEEFIRINIDTTSPGYSYIFATGVK